jgi:hypothetical protein
MFNQSSLIACLINKKTLVAMPGFMLFFMMLFMPTTYQPIKAILLGLVLTMICLLAIVKMKIALHPKILLLTLFFTTTGLFFILRGLINAAPGALRVGTVYVLWPLVYMVLVAGISNKTMLKNILRLLVIATVVIEIYSLTYIFYSAGWLPSYFYIPLDLGQAIGFYSGFIEYNLYSISSLVFLVPFLIAALLTWPSNMKLPVSRFWLWISLIIGIALVLLSGRRALMLVSGLAPIFTLIFRHFLPRKIKLANRKVLIQTFIKVFIVALIALFYLNLVHGIKFISLINEFLVGFDFQSDPSAIARKTQFFALLDGWSQYPFLGAGHGAGVAYLRSTKQPWAYELSYVALLYQTGLIGFIIYMSGFVWIFWKGLRVIKSDASLGLQLLPVLVGTSCFLIANATNPYLGKYDNIWVVFLPIAFINYWLLSQRCKENANKCSKDEQV